MNINELFREKMGLRLYIENLLDFQQYRRRFIAFIFERINIASMVNHVLDIWRRF